jgi:hypothetical protein
LALAAISAERLNPLVAYELIFDVPVVIRPKKIAFSTGGILFRDAEDEIWKAVAYAMHPVAAKVRNFAERLFQGSSRLRRRRTQRRPMQRKKRDRRCFHKNKSRLSNFCVYFHPPSKTRPVRILHAIG